MALEPLVLSRGRPRTVDLIERIRELEIEAHAAADEERAVLGAVRTRTGRALLLLAGGQDFAAAHALKSVIYSVDRRARQLAAVDEAEVTA
jgi:hypothetical protein